MGRTKSARPQGADFSGAEGAPDQDVESSEAIHPDAEAIHVALTCAGDSAEDFRLLELGRDAAQRALTVCNTRIEQAKAKVSEVRSVVQVLEPRAYSVPGIGNFTPPAGTRYDRAKQPDHYRAIVAQGRAGQHFEFAGA